MHQTMLLIVLLLLTGNTCILGQRDPIEVEYSRIFKNNVEKINANFSKILLGDLKPEENFIFSPINIYGALALVHLGATSTTKTELSNVLGLPVEDNKLNETHQNLGQFMYDIQHPRFESAQVNIANAIFVQQGLKLKDEYSKETVAYYNSETKEVKFNQTGSEATDTVNKWIAEATRQRIPKLFGDEIPKNTVILLTSALYFAGKWSKSFDTSDTETKPFNTGLKQIQVPTMRTNESVPYFDNKELKYQAVSVPYLYGEFSMLIVLPYREQSLKTLINSLEAGKLSEIIASLKPTYVNYEIPRMKFSFMRDINQYLEKLGIKQMFKNAELGKMTDLNNLRVSKVTHAAEIEVNEEGTVASAVTALQVTLTSLPLFTDSPIPFHADRPFLFSIYQIGRAHV